MPIYVAVTAPHCISPALSRAGAASCCAQQKTSTCGRYAAYKVFVSCIDMHPINCQTKICRYMHLRDTSESGSSKGILGH